MKSNVVKFPDPPEPDLHRAAAVGELKLGLWQLRHAGLHVWLGVGNLVHGAWLYLKNLLRKKR